VSVSRYPELDPEAAEAAKTARDLALIGASLTDISDNLRRVRGDRERELRELRQRAAKRDPV
jgi:hypothetical protein